MAVLTAPGRARLGGGKARRLGCLCSVAAFWFVGALGASAPEHEVREFQIKAVFLFNFAQFVEWPPDAFSSATEPFVIGILGNDPFGPYLDQAVRGEKVNNRSISIVRFDRAEDIKTCHILYISRSEAGRLEQILSVLRGRSILTVSDAEQSGHLGGMIRFVTENNKVRLRIDNEAAKSAGLKISSKLLRPSQLVSLRRGAP
jgi:YfiR/HmsC-like